MAFAFASCSEKDLYDESKKEKGVADLNVPVDFDWNMVRGVTCNFSTSSTSMVAVYTDASCKDNSLVAEYTLFPDMEALTLPIATGVSKLYIVANGETTVVDVNNDSATASIGTPTRANDALPGEFIGYIYFPAKYEKGNTETWATVMFEDYFPVVGDYDFNDFVANYRYTAELSRNQGGGNDNTYWKYHIISVTFDVQVRALGGQYKYDPYIRLEGMKVNNAAVGFVGDGATLMTSGNDPVVRIDNAVKPTGVEYLNTKLNEARVCEPELKVTTFTVGSNNDSGTGVPQKHVKFDFFLKGTGYLGSLCEIHQKGFSAIDTEYPTGFGLGIGNNSYSNDKNLIWGFTVPAKIQHATERTNFLSAYPDFAAWVESGGVTTFSNWYDNKRNEHLFPLIP